MFHGHVELRSHSRPHEPRRGGAEAKIRKKENPLHETASKFDNALRWEFFTRSAILSG